MKTASKSLREYFGKLRKESRVERQYPVSITKFFVDGINRSGILGKDNKMVLNEH